MAFKSRTAHRLPDLTLVSAVYLGETAVDALFLGETEEWSGAGFEVGDALLIEAGDFLLLESGDKILIDF